MKQKKSNRKKEALRANKHKIQDTKPTVENPYLVKDLTTTLVSTLVCILLGVLLYYLLS